MQYITYHPIAICSLPTFLVSFLFPVFGNFGIVYFGTVFIYFTGNLKKSLIYLPIGLIAGQLSMLTYQNFHFNKSNFWCAILTLGAWLLGLVVGKVQKAKYYPWKK